MADETVKIGTRGSVLALYQADLIGRLLREAVPSLKVEIVKILTSGDKDKNRPFSPLETKRIFTKEIEQALLSREVDIAVHSAKDVAVDLPTGLVVGAVPEREDARDCLLTAEGKKFSELPAGAKVGTSSMRRRKQIERLRPDLVTAEIRGNVETRLKKMLAGEFDAIVLAYAGMKRINMTRYVSEIFEPISFYPAPGQGALLVEIRSGDGDLAGHLKKITHAESADLLFCERAFLKQLEGGCQLPCGIHSRLEGGRIKMTGALFSIEGKDFVEKTAEFSAADPVKAGISLAQMILDDGGEAIIRKIRGSGMH